MNYTIFRIHRGAWRNVDISDPSWLVWFATGKGTPLDAQNIVNRHVKPLLRCAGLPDIRRHDLRHTCATLLLGRGVHPKMSNICWGMPASSQPSTGTRTGYQRWADKLRTEWMRLWDRVYCLRTADKAPDTNIGGFSFLRDLQAKQRADERTRTSYPCSSYE
jgi:integrase